MAFIVFTKVGKGRAKAGFRVMLKYFEIKKAFRYCVVPENIHTPTTEGIGNSKGEGWSKTQEIPEGRGVA